MSDNDKNLQTAGRFVAGDQESSSRAPETAIAASAKCIPKAAPPLVAPMTFREAIDAFHSDRPYSSPALRAVINDIIDRNIKTEFSNDSYPDALALTDVMFCRSNQNIRILTGNRGDSFLEALKESFIKALDSIKSNGGKVKVIVLAPTHKFLTGLKNMYPATLDVIAAHAPMGLKHFTVCDSRMARLEDAHTALEDNSPITAVKARVYFNDPIQSKMLEDGFDQLWNRLKSLMEKSASAPQ